MIGYKDSLVGLLAQDEIHQSRKVCMCLGPMKDMVSDGPSFGPGDAASLVGLGHKKGFCGSDKRMKLESGFR